MLRLLDVLCQNMQPGRGGQTLAHGPTPFPCHRFTLSHSEKKPHINIQNTPFSHVSSTVPPPRQVTRPWPLLRQKGTQQCHTRRDSWNRLVRSLQVGSGWFGQGIQGASYLVYDLKREASQQLPLAIRTPQPVWRDVLDRAKVWSS